MLVLAFETSCDETAVALYSAHEGLLSHYIYSQTDLHNLYGGVVPELAARDHLLRLWPLVEACLKDAGKTLKDVEGIGYTKGPGLVPALLVGASFAQTLALRLQVPCLGVHHLEGHILAPMLENHRPDFPFLALLVSGGHTELIHAEDFGKYHILGQTLDDAAGEAFDKVAKLLGLGYPGGKALSELAQQGTAQRFKLPRPMLDRPGCDFSFSGLKTAALHTWQNTSQTPQDAADLARAFQSAVIETLIEKTARALSITQSKQLVFAGGVSANQYLRELAHTRFEKQNINVFFPRLEFCTDNAAMIAYTACHYLILGKTSPFEVCARWKLSDL